MPPTPDQIANLIDRMKATYAGTSTTLRYLNDPNLDKLLGQWGIDKGSTINLGRRDGTYYEAIDLYSSISLIQDNAQYNIEFLGGLLMTIISFVGDALKRNKYFTKSPELEFFRHLRNAISHGNRFYFKGDEPKRPAKFRNFVLDKSLHGQPALFDYMSPGDVFDLFDEIENQLRNLP